MSQPFSPSALEDPAVFQSPGLTPPPGTTPNFTHPTDRGPVLIVVNGILLALMMVFIAIRSYTKLAIVRKVSWDDLSVCLSALGGITLYLLFVWRKYLSHHYSFEFLLMHRSLQRSKGPLWADTNGMSTLATFLATTLLLFVLGKRYIRHFIR